MAGETRETRAARNENLFRRVNERLHALARIEGSPERLERFVCECFRSDCSTVVELTADEYRSARAGGARFLTVPDALHTSPDLEVVLERHERYWLVEKRGEAARVAETLADQAPTAL